MVHLNKFHILYQKKKEKLNHIAKVLCKTKKGISKDTNHSIYLSASLVNSILADSEI
jgi:hypothetical protein